MAAPTQNREAIERRLQEIPAEPGIYLMRDGREEILYIGKSKKLRSRVRSYFRDCSSLSPRLALMVQQVAEIEFIVTDTEAEALALEANLIKQHQPYFNVLLKDDKKYPYLCITWSEDYPRLFITRQRRPGSQKDRYYGPYVDARLLRQTLQLVQRTFPLRQRPRPLFPDRPCLNYDIGRCPGVCQQRVSVEDYRQTVQEAAMVFQGRGGELVKALHSQMEEAAGALDFERAAAIRDRIRALNALNADRKVSLPDPTISRDAVALARDGRHCSIQLFQIRAGRLVGRLGFFADAGTGPAGAILQRVLEEHYWHADPVEVPQEILLQHPLPEAELLAAWLSDRKGRKVTLSVPQRRGKADLIALVERNAQYELERTQRREGSALQALQDLAEILDLPDLPRRIEGYDISHLQGTHAVASRVTFIDGVPAKQHYRHYKIQNPRIQLGHSDDFASLAETLRRRFRQLGGKERGGSGLVADDLPDLVLIDGGKGQLSAVVAALQELELLSELRVVSLAKQREEVFIPGASQPLPTKPEQPGIKLLRRVRDEAHRFAVSFHRQQRLKDSRRSRLEEIPGLGFQRQKQLLAHFRSVDYIRSASVEQLMAVEGIGPGLAAAIYRYFHPS